MHMRRRKHACSPHSACGLTIEQKKSGHLKKVKKINSNTNACLQPALGVRVDNLHEVQGLQDHLVVKYSSKAQ